jgi:hypothetical protein
VIAGSFVKGDLHGECIMTKANGEKYIGDWDKGIFKPIKKKSFLVRTLTLADVVQKASSFIYCP